MVGLRVLEGNCISDPPIQGELFRSRRRAETARVLCMKRNTITKITIQAIILAIAESR
jgi:hypothetical protein